MICVGICVGYFTCYGTTGIRSSLSWRLPLALQAGIAALLALTSFLYLPQSPRWLSSVGRMDEATRVWDRLGVSGAEREKNEELLPIVGLEPVQQSHPSQPRSTSTSNGKPWLAQFSDGLAVFRNPGRKQMALGVFMMAMQQLSGIDGVLYVNKPPSLLQHHPLYFTQIPDTKYQKKLS